ncbi:probable galacturonosyltransferase 6 [Ananas comosus]|uniref:Hexosyltransferase n=1 Tax=Ananas comosus TaxID=4615 RepID=A0A6P5G3D9_ANACO|nr:probable galacturonosyltransferase 6 [Ananas comosus]
MRLIVRSPRILLPLLLLGVPFAIVSGLLFVNLPSDFSPPSLSNRFGRKELGGEGSRLVKNVSPGHSADSMRLNAINMDIDGRLKEPTGTVYEDDKSHIEAVPSSENEGGELNKSNVPISTKGEKLEQSDKATVREDNGGSRSQNGPKEKIWEMEDQLIMAKAYLRFAPPGSNSHLVRELKLRIKESERVLGQASKDSDLSRSALQKMRAMGSTLSKAHRAYPDCPSMASKLRAMTYSTEEQLRAQQSEASYLMQVNARTLPKGLHCLSMQLTSEYFSLESKEMEFPNRDRVRQPHLYHYAIFSDNVLACAVVVSSTVSASKEPDKVVFHVVTDSLNFPAMKMWFLLNSPHPAAIQIESLENFQQWLPSNFSSAFKQSGVKDPRFTSPLNHLRFYLPEIFPYLSKILLLDHDVVVQRDLSELWKMDMKGKVIGVVETCREGESLNQLKSFLNFSDPTIQDSFNAKSCIWAFGMNIFDLNEWRRRGLTTSYHNWLQAGKRRQLWKVGSLPLGQMVFYNRTMALDRRWHVLGLGHDTNLERYEIERAAVIHYDGNMKPWLEISIPKYRGYWNKFVNYDNPFLQQCNIHK